MRISTVSLAAAPRKGGCWFRRALSALSLALVLSFVSGCAGYATRVAGPRAMLQRGEFDKAIAELEKLAALKDNDELLFLFDLGVAYHSAGRYRDAIGAFQRAEKVADVMNYVSVSAEVGSTILNDQVKKYRGEDFEKLLIPVFSALDFTLLGERESALVEARKVNHYIDLLVAKGEKKFKHNAFAKYLAAVLFEAGREYNDALVDYRQLLKWGYQNYPYLGPELVKLSRALNMSQEAEEFSKRFPNAKAKLPAGYGEIVLIVELGKAPLKVPTPGSELIPMFQKSYYSGSAAVLRVGTASAESATLYDIEETAIRELEEARAGIVAKKLTGVVAKQAVAYGVQEATKSEGLGLLTALVLHATDQADLRSWSTLPARLQLARLAVPAGTQAATLDLKVSDGAPRPAIRNWDKVIVKAGQITFLHARVLD